MDPKAEIISIGDELLYGQVVDTNSHWISTELDRVGIRVIRRTTIGDQEDNILKAFEEAETLADIILITGGLGPTDDDLTKGCLAKFFNCELQMDEEALKDVENIFSKIGLELNEVNRHQALLPKACEKITNRKGTAPGMWFKKDSTIFISMPGVPGEMRYMMLEGVIPRLLQEFKPGSIYHKMVKTVGVGESWLSERIAPWVKTLPEFVSLAYLPDLGQVKLRLTASGENARVLEDETGKLLADLKTYIGKYIYGYDEEELEDHIGSLLNEQNKTIAIAESCTGGFISHKISRVSGCSKYYRGTIIAYHNELKEQLLDVKEETLINYGAVSEETVTEMARMVRKKLGADIGLACSGIAGPLGGTPEKPVGTIWIACTDGQRVQTKKLQLFKDRIMNIESSGVAALNLVRLTLLQSVEINS